MSFYLVLSLEIFSDISFIKLVKRRISDSSEDYNRREELIMLLDYYKCSIIGIILEKRIN